MSAYSACTEVSRQNLISCLKSTPSRDPMMFLMKEFSATYCGLTQIKLMDGHPMIEEFHLSLAKILSRNSAKNMRSILYAELTK